MQLKTELKRRLRAARLSAQGYIGPAGYLALSQRAIAGAGVAKGARYDHIIVAPSGEGNIGDQALVEACIRGTVGTVLLVAKKTISYVTSDFPDRVTVMTAPELISGGLRKNVAALPALAAHFHPGTHLWVIGADVMDGGYNPTDSTARFNLTRVARKCRMHATVTPFSWNSSPSRNATGAVRLAAKEGVRIYARDPRSSARLRALGVACEDAADIVFGDPQQDADAGVMATVDAFTSEKLAIVNVSGLVRNVPGLADAYVSVVSTLRGEGYSVLILPHVIRPSADDLSVCKALYASFSADPEVALVHELLRPANVRALTARATLVVTGRMHLAVMTMMNARPAVTLSTQGKVEGLMELFGVPEMSIETDASGAQALRAAVTGVLSRTEELSARISEQLPKVTEMALRPYV